MAFTGLTNPGPSTNERDGFFLIICILLFATCTAFTIREYVNMAAMGDMPMAGGWTMSMMWMLMPGQTWLDATISFTTMWSVMMIAMMLPVLLPTLSRYRYSLIGSSTTRRNRLTLALGLGYFSTWMLLGILIFPLGVLFAEFTMQNGGVASAVPSVSALVAIIAGATQFTSWKMHRLNCCRNAIKNSVAIEARINSAWRYGFHLGLHCNYCCAGLTVVLLVVGVMNPLAMILIASAIALERLAPSAELSAKLIGFVLLGSGLYQAFTEIRF